MEGDAFLPSEIARLVLGYLKRNGCNQAYGGFLKESPHLKEYVSLLKQGTVYPTTIHGKNLEQMLQEYGRMLLGLPNQQLNDALHKKLDSLLERLACLEAVQRTVIPGHHSSPAPNTVAKSGSLRRKCKLSANYCHTEGSLLESSSTKKHITCSRSGPTHGKQTNMGLHSGIICGGQRTVLGSSSPVLSGRDKVNCLVACGDDSPNQERGQSSVCDVHGWNLTTVLNRDQIQTSYASTISSSSEAMSPLHVRNKAVMANAPEPSFDLPELIDSLRNSSHRTQDASGKKVLDTQRHKETSAQQHGPGELKQPTPISSCLPDFDQLSFSPEDSSSSCQKTNNARGKSKKTVPSSKDVMLTPVKNVPREQKAEMKMASPRRKRQLPKRRSTSSDFPLIGRPQIRPTQSGPVEACIANSNDSFMSQASQGFVPCIEELCHNSRFAEKLAESINKVSEIKLGNKPSDAVVGTKSTSVTSNDGKMESTGQTSDAEKKTDRSNVTSDLLDQLLMQEDTINNIIDMTTNDPDFDVLFNMFHVDKNEFIEKEYGVKVSNQSSSSQSISFASILDSDTGPHTSFQIHQPNQQDITETETAGKVRSPTDVTSPAVDSKEDPSSEQHTSTSATNPTTSVVTVSDLSGTVLHLVPAQVSTAEALTESTDCSATIQHDAESSCVLNASLSDSSSHLVELVIPTVDGKGSTMEVVEVITIAADQATAPSTSGMVAEQTQDPNSAAGNASLKAASSESDLGRVGNVLDAKTEPAHSCGKSDLDSLSESSQTLIQAVNQLNTLLSHLNQAITPQKVNRSSADGLLLPELAELSQSTIGKLVNLQQQLTGCSATSHSPAMSTQLESAEAGSKIGIITPQSPSSKPVHTFSGLEDTVSKAVPKGRSCSSLEPKAKRRKRSTEPSPPESDSVSKSGQNRLYTDKENLTKSGDQTSQKSKERATKSKPRKKKNRAFVEPWKVNHQQDKRKFLGILWKHGSVPVDKVIVSEESASLLVGRGISDEPSEQISTTPKQPKPHKVDKNRQKRSVQVTGLPELSAKDVVDVANSPGVASSVDASCLALTSLSGHSSAATTGTSDRHSFTGNSSSPMGDTEKAGNHIRMLNFGSASVPAQLPVKKTVEGTSFGPSMPSSFDFVFEKNKRLQERKKHSEHKEAEKSCSAAKDAQSLAEKKEETEIAQTLISLATLPVFSQKEDATVEQSNGAKVQTEIVQKDAKDSLAEKLQWSDPEESADACTKNSSVQVKEALQTNGISTASEEMLQNKRVSAENSIQRMELASVRTGDNLGSSSTFQLPKQVTQVSKSTPSVGCVVITDSSFPDEQQNQNHINMRVATKPKSIEKRKSEEGEDKEERQRHCQQGSEKNSVESSSEERKTSFKHELLQTSSQVSLTEQSDSSLSSTRRTPIKCKNIKLPASRFCSPKRTHVLTKLIEQGMKAKSPKLDKTLGRADCNNTSQTKGAKMSKISLSDVDMEKILSKIHK